MIRDLAKEKAAYQKRLSMIGIIGAPFFIALGMGLQAHFEGPSPLALLNEGSNAMIALGIGAVGVFAESAYAVYLALKIRSLGGMPR